MITKKITCIVCPISCSIEVDINKKIYIANIRGNKCKLGIDYAKFEAISPKRILTTTVKVIGHHDSLVSVRSVKPIPKDKIFKAMEILKSLEINSPVNTNDVIHENIANTGVNVIATRNSI